MTAIRIALCGNPTAGKTEVQKILHDIWQVRPADDGYCLRDFAMRHLGAKFADVHTQEGKRRQVLLPGGKVMTWREFLGEFGNRIEDLLGPDSIPEIALRACEPDVPYSFGSVRREQGLVFKRHGGIVVGIRAPWAGPSPHEFDRFNPEHVDFWIDNEVKDRRALERKVWERIAVPYGLASITAALRGESFDVVS